MAQFFPTGKLDSEKEKKKKENEEIEKESSIQFSFRSDFKDPFSISPNISIFLPIKL